MKKKEKRLSIIFYFLVGFLIFFSLLIYGTEYYTLKLSERFFHPKHQMLNPSGTLGHILGIVGSSFIFFGVFIYLVRKRWKKLFRIGYLKYWLEFHIFLCSTGSLLILFHTAFKFGGIISIGFWSLVTVVLSGIVGRLIYIQIPRSLQGEKLSKIELEKRLLDSVSEIDDVLRIKFEKIILIKPFDKKTDKNFFRNLKLILYEIKEQKQKLLTLKSLVKESHDLNPEQKSTILIKIKEIISLQSKISLYNSFEVLFKHWHIFHLPFAFIMFFLMFVHIIIVLIFAVN